jgi:hypothetical protein
MNLKPKLFWLQQKFSDLSLVDQNLPDSITKGTNKIFTFKCDCGNIKDLMGCWVFLGDVKSCGRCDQKSKEWWLSQKFGKLCLIDKDLPDFLPVYHTKKLLFKCECGNTKLLRAGNVFKGIFNKKGRTISCGTCEGNTKEWWLQQKFGKLKLDPKQILPNYITRGTAFKYTFIYDCGKIKWEGIVSSLSCIDQVEAYIKSQVKPQ